MAKIQVCLGGEAYRESVIRLCRRLGGKVKSRDDVVVVKIHPPVKRIILFLESQRPMVASAKKIKKN